MKQLLQHILEHCNAPLHSAIVIGAGNGRQLADLRALGAEYLLLVEAHPRLAEELSRRLQPEQGEQLLALAVTAAPCSEARLLTFNNPAYSSLNAPTALQEHYPNLHALETLPVPARGIEQLLSEKDLDAEAVHLLAIDAPGQALELLQAIPAQTLQAFTWLIIDCAVEPLYEDDAGSEAIGAWLQEIGFDPIQEDPDAIYPHSRLLLQRNHANVQRQRLQAEASVLRTQLAAEQQTSQQHITELQQQLKNCRDAATEQAKVATEQQQRIETLEGLIAERHVLAKSNTELTQARDEQAKLAAERQAQIEALSKEKTELTAARDALAKSKTELNQARDEQTKLATERQAQIEVLSTEKTELTAARDALAKSKTELTQARDEQAKLAAEQQEQIEALSKEKIELTAARDALAKEKTELVQARDEQTKLAAERKAQLDKITAERDQAQKTTNERQKALDQAQQQIKTLESDASENLQRQQLLQEELIKAEAQIELIKDLLLRESGL